MPDQLLRCADISPVGPEVIFCYTEGGSFPISLTKLFELDHPLFNGQLDSILSESARPVLELEEGGDLVVVKNHNQRTWIPEPEPENGKGDYICLSLSPTPADGVRRIVLDHLKDLVEEHRDGGCEKGNVYLWPSSRVLLVSW